MDKTKGKSQLWKLSIADIPSIFIDVIFFFLIDKLEKRYVPFLARILTRNDENIDFYDVAYLQKYFIFTRMHYNSYATIRISEFLLTIIRKHQICEGISCPKSLGHPYIANK